MPVEVGERISGTLSSVEQRREMFVGKPALEIVPLLVASMPEIEDFEIISYQRGLCVADVYPSIGMQFVEGLAESFPLDREGALRPDYWKEMAEDVKKIHIPHDYPDGSPVGPEEAAAWYEMYKEDEDEDREVHLSLSSRVRGVAPPYPNPRQIPLMDFTCVPSVDSLLSVKNLLIASGQEKGIILHSGQSYHYYGLITLSPGEWRAWMEVWSRNTWIWPWADSKFIRKSLEDGFNFLRLTSGASKPVIPVVVDVI